MTQANVLHRSNTGDIISTPVQIDDKGQFFIERWPQLQAKRYPSLDFLIHALKTDVQLTAVSASTLPSVRLKNIGDFLVEYASSTQASLLHRSRTGEIITTPIKSDELGQLSIERWPLLQGKRYATIEGLVDALKKEVRLTAVA